MADRDAFPRAVVARLRDLMQSRGVTAAGLERDLGRGRGYLADALRGDKRLTLETLGEILDLLAISPEAFFKSAPSAYPAEPVASEIAESSAQWDCPCGRLARRFDDLTTALEQAGVLDADLASRLRER